MVQKVNPYIFSVKIGLVSDFLEFHLDSIIIHTASLIVKIVISIQFRFTTV